MSREKILGRVREALTVKSDEHVRHAISASPAQLPVLANGPDGSVQAVKEFLPQVGPSLQDHCDTFQVLSTKLQTEFLRFDSIEAAAAQLASMARDLEWSKAGFHQHPLVEQLTADLQLEMLNTSEAYAVGDLESCDVGISGCDALIAQTASALVTNHSAGGRGLSVLPPHHVVIATAEQMLTTMADGFALLREKHQENWPSFVSFITGPSRTADIERVLVLGAHGPKKLTIMMVG